MRRIFKDNDKEKEITERGYVVVRQFADLPVCNDLFCYFDENKVHDDRAFTISNWNNDTGYRQNTFKKIAGTLKPLADRILVEYTPVMGVFTVKRPGPKSDMLLHQDWSLVDESCYRSVSVWLALVDMDSLNGNLQLAEGSHLYCGFPRGMNVPVPFENIRNEMYDYLTGVPLKKGDAIIFDHRVIHASPENNSNSIRLAAVLALIPSESELVHYYKYPEDNEHLEMLIVDKNEFHKLDFFDIPNKPRHIASLKKYSTSFPQLKISDIQSEYGQSAEYSSKN